ncbi:TMEM175 family protein [Phenylobacterium sp.]|uniref:TMEM175 family protein n=1 Tax=Phenylobacterium sp. TaxID=1871053 RepID=UPI0025CD52B5|nr:TMEM175 family protein [Phenylobacterium sp.]
MAHDDEAHLDERLLHRLLFFTDAVFAIVLTLLVLELRPPPVRDVEGPAHAIAEMGPHFLAFFMSFALIGVFWGAHMNTSRRMIRFDWPTAWTNLAFLFPICLIPFVSAWYGQGLGSPFIWAMYCWVLVGTSAGNMALVLVMARGGGRLMAPGFSPQERTYRVARAAGPGLSFGFGLLMLAAGQYILGQFCWVLIPVLFGVIEATLKPRGPQPVAGPV